MDNSRSVIALWYFQDPPQTAQLSVWQYYKPTPNERSHVCILEWVVKLVNHTSIFFTCPVASSNIHEQYITCYFATNPLQGVSDRCSMPGALVWIGVQFTHVKTMGFNHYK